jgi:hypothetical protein
MNLPVVLDIAIGLVFIYLIASLLASEMQELLSTLLQWRAKHLRESIQNLLSGGQGTPQTDLVAGFVGEIYNDPLVKNVNQSARGLLGSLGQWFYHLIYPKSVFGNQTTAPSYIASETFATALLEQLGMPLLIDKLTEIRLEKFVTRVVGLYTIENGRPIVPAEDFFNDKDNWERGSIRVLAEKARILGHDDAATAESHSPMLNLSQDSDFMALVEDYDDILNDFESGQADLETCVERMSEGLDVYINQVGERVAMMLNREVAIPNGSGGGESAASMGIDSGAGLGNGEAEAATSLVTGQFEQKRLAYFKKRLESFKKGIFGEKSERAIDSGKLKPNLLEIAEFFDRTSTTYQEMATAYRDVAAAYEVGQTPETAYPVLTLLTDKVSETYAGEANAAFGSAPVVSEIPPEANPEIFGQPIDPSTGFAAEATASGEAALDAVNTAPIRLTLTPMDLFKTEYRPYVETALKTLTPEQLTLYRGWQIYQQVVFRVASLLAKDLLKRGRLFDADGNQELEAIDEFTQQELNRIVEQSIDMLSNDERQLAMNTVLLSLSPEQRKTYRNYRTYLEAQRMLDRVPDSVKRSLAILARRAQTKVQQTERQLNQFRTEVSIWFDRSMSRASGVYKRNAKGVAIMIGCTIALVSNADTFHIVARLASDDDLRNVITTRASEITANMPDDPIANRDQLRILKKQTSEVLAEVQFPLQWSPVNLRQQFGCTPDPNRAVDLTDWKTFYQDCLGKEVEADQFDLGKLLQIAGKHWVDTGRVALGWLVSGVAIAMGAPFWFDVLSKVMNVRNTGAKPATVAEKDTASK